MNSAYDHAGKVRFAQKRTDEGDFDAVSIWINRGLFYPGSEQSALWQSSQADVKGSNNLGGVKNKPVDALLKYLQDWLTQHIMGTDKQLAALLDGRT